MAIKPTQIEGQSDKHFQLLEHLGSGGFAHTYKARPLDPDAVEDYGADVVAIKIPLNYRKERQLRKEVELNARLFIDITSAQSLNIVRYLGFGIFREQIVMVMEYVPDGSLRDLIGKVGVQKPMVIEQAVEITLGILSGVIAMHKAHVFHRDLKPENILLDGLIPKISDLGIARMLESDELASTTTGTVYYMAPEILCDEGASFSADVWSIGVTLYEMVTGKLPFGGPRTPIGTMVSLICEKKQIPASEARSEIPEALSKIIDRALEKDPRNRYQTGEEMLQALECLKQQMSPESVKNIDNKDISTEEKLKSAVLANPDKPEEYLRFGQFLNKGHRYNEAIEIFHKGLGCFPNHAQLQWNMAMSQLAINNPSKACHHMKQAMSLGLPKSLKGRANVLLQQLKCSQSKENHSSEELEQLLEQARLNEFNADIEAKLLSALKQFPRSTRVRQMLGEYFNRLQRYPEAIRIFKDGVDLNPNNPILLWDLALAYYGARQQKNAAKYLEEAMRAGLDVTRERHARYLLTMLRRGK